MFADLMGGGCFSSHFDIIMVATACELDNQFTHFWPKKLRTFYKLVFVMTFVSVSCIADIIQRLLNESRFFFWFSNFS